MKRHNLFDPSRTYYAFSSVEIPENDMANGKRTYNLRNPVIIPGNSTNEEIMSPTNAKKGRSQTTSSKKPTSRSHSSCLPKETLSKNSLSQSKSNSVSAVTSINSEKTSRMDSKNSNGLSHRSSSSSYRCSPPGSDSDLDSDSSVESFFRTGNKKNMLECMRLPYTAKEDEEILKFVLTENNIYKTSGIALWKKLEDLKVNPKRTYQSLKNRFLRNIKPVVFSRFRYLLTKDMVCKLKKKFPEFRNHSRRAPLPLTTSGSPERPHLHRHPSFNNVTRDCTIALSKLPRITEDVTNSEDFIESQQTNYRTLLSVKENGNASSQPGRKGLNVLRDGTRIGISSRSVELRQVTGSQTLSVTRKDAETITELINSEEPIRNIAFQSNHSGLVNSLEESQVSLPVQTIQLPCQDLLSRNPRIDIKIVLQNVSDSMDCHDFQTLAKSVQNLQVNVILACGGNKNDRSIAFECQSSGKKRKQLDQRVVKGKKSWNKNRSTCSTSLHTREFRFKRTKSLSGAEKTLLFKLLKKLKKISKKKSFSSAPETELNSSQPCSTALTEKTSTKTIQETAPEDEMPSLVAEVVKNMKTESADFDFEDVESIISTNCSSEFNSSYAQMFQKTTEAYPLVMQMTPEETTKETPESQRGLGQTSGAIPLDPEQLNATKSLDVRTTMRKSQPIVLTGAEKPHWVPAGRETLQKNDKGIALGNQVLLGNMIEMLRKDLGSQTNHLNSLAKRSE